ncbi:MAG: hypothetical protein ACRDT8_22135 [Micromonosporaceae bacterium]
MATTREPWQPRIVPKLIAKGCEQTRAEGIAAAIESQKTITRADGAYLYAALGEADLAQEYADAES